MDDVVRLQVEIPGGDAVHTKLLSLLLDSAREQSRHALAEMQIMELLGGPMPERIAQGVVLGFVNAWVEGHRDQVVAEIEKRMLSWKKNLDAIVKAAMEQATAGMVDQVVAKVRAEVESKIDNRLFGPDGPMAGMLVELVKAEVRPVVAEQVRRMAPAIQRMATPIINEEAAEVAVG